jgi:hypothetical protein
VANKRHRSEAGHTNGTDIPQQVVKNILAKPGASTQDLYEADSDFRYGAETPDNPATTMRVLTIMLARDW